MTSTAGRAPSTVRARFASPRNLLPVAAIVLAVLGAALFARSYFADDKAPALVTIEADHRAQLEANIQFFETRVRETKDHLSYDRLTTLYLQRLRETGDVSDVRRAETSALASLEANPGVYTGTLNLALVRIAQHDFRDAEALALKASEVKPAAPDSQAVLGDAQMALGKYDEAAASYRRYLELAPGFNAFARSANIAEVRGNVPLASQFWGLAIEVSAAEVPADSAWARVQLGNLLFLTGDQDGARKEYETALRIYPRLHGAEAGLARSLAAEGNYDDALEIYAALVERLPLLEYVIAYGETLDAAGRKGDAQRQFALVNAIEQLFVANGVKNDLPLVNFRLDHGSTAEMPALLAAAEGAYAERPSIAAADTLAWALYRNGRFDEARAMSDEALRTGAQDPALNFHAAAIANAQGDKASALAHSKKVAELNPKFSLLHAPEAASLLKSLEAAR